MTEAVPWVKWRFDKWRDDAGLRMCSLAARGLWIELIAIMHGCEPYGHLSVRGRSPTNKQIAGLVGMTSEKEVAALLRELEENGVFSRSSEGLIYCRRLLRDNTARLEGKANGLRGGNPLLKKNLSDGDKPNGRDHDKPLVNHQTYVSVNPPVNPSVNPSVNAPLYDRVRVREETREESKPRASSFVGLDGIEIEASTGRQTINGKYLDWTKEHAFEAAGIDDTKWYGRSDMLVEWLREGIEPETIVAAIKRSASRSGYTIPTTSLKYFDIPVREEHGRLPPKKAWE